MISDTDAVRKGWSDLLLRYDWQWFCTFTFRESVHPERADKLFRVWISKINRNLFGPRWHKLPEQCVFWVRGLEWQKRDVIHYHVLMGCPIRNLEYQLSRKYWAAVWKDLAGFARIESIRSREDVAAYLTKYTTKGGEIDFSPNMSVADTFMGELELEEQILALESELKSEADGPI